MPLLSDYKVPLRGTGSTAGGMGLQVPIFRKMTAMVNGSQFIDQSIEQYLSTYEMSLVLTPGMMTSDIERRFDLNTELRARIGSAPSRDDNIVPSSAYQKHLKVGPTQQATSDATRRGKPIAMRGDPVHRVHWHFLRHEVQEKARSFLSSDQQLHLVQMMTDWMKLSANITKCAEDAEASIADAIKETSAVRQARMGFVGKVIWLVLTTSTPPPAGALTGAVVRAVLAKESWIEVVRDTTEWTLQAPFPHNAAGRTDLKAPNRGPGKDTKSPALNYIGGHPSLRELKDAHQTLQEFDGCFSGSARETLDKINKYTLGALAKLPPPPEHAGGPIYSAIQQECALKVAAIRTAVADLIVEFAASTTGAGMLVNASFRFQQDAIERELARSRFPPVSYIKEVVLEGVRLYINTMADQVMLALVSMLQSRRVPAIDKAAAKREFEILFMAHYLAANIERPKRPPDTGNTADETFWAKNNGTVKSSIWSGPLETKLAALGITQKFAGKSIVGTGRTDDYAQSIRDWSPPEREGDFRAVPYQKGGANARGRLAAWAVEYSARPVDETLKAIFGPFK